MQYDTTKQRLSLGTKNSQGLTSAVSDECRSLEVEMKFPKLDALAIETMTLVSCEALYSER